MEPSLDTLNAFRPRTGTADQWNAAFIRVEDYLRAHRVHNRLQQITVLQKVIARAAARHEQNPALAELESAQMLRHVVNHSTYHRGQVTTILRQLGVPPPSTDLIAYYRDAAPPLIA